jgi:N6-L-threonylcarbamoyladenine synthase
MINTKDYDFSFSGLKTAVLYSWQKITTGSVFVSRQKHYQLQVEFASEIQQAIIDVLFKKTIKAVKDYKAKTLILGGGVSANKELRKQFQKAISLKNPNGSTAVEPFILLFPPADLSTDNALMTAITAYFHRTKKIGWKKLRSDANLRISK